MENKKTKLTISGKVKKTINNFDTSKSQSKKTVIIDKKSKSFGKTTGNKNSGFKQSSSFKKGISSKNNFLSKSQPITSDFERRKLAEQRATKRLKGDTDIEKKNKARTKEKRVEANGI